MIARIASALVMIPSFLAIVVYAPPWILLPLLGIIGSLCLYEFFGLVERMEMAPQHWTGYASFWILLVGLRAKWLSAAQLVAVVLIFSFVAALASQGGMRQRASGMMSSLAGVFYLSFCLHPALAVRYDFGENGLKWLLLAFAILWSGDTLAMLVGRKWGRTPLAPSISPKKTVAGAAAGLAAGILAASICRQALWTELPVKHVISIAVLLGVVGQLGDLAESLLKRAAEVKDSSHLIPGHGGVLDRIDSLLFALPALNLYLTFLYGGAG